MAAVGLWDQGEQLPWGAWTVPTMFPLVRGPSPKALRRKQHCLEWAALGGIPFMGQPTRGLPVHSRVRSSAAFQGRVQRLLMTRLFAPIGGSYGPCSQSHVPWVVTALAPIMVVHPIQRLPLPLAGSLEQLSPVGIVIVIQVSSHSAPPKLPLSVWLLPRCGCFWPGRHRQLWAWVPILQ